MRAVIVLGAGLAAVTACGREPARLNVRLVDPRPHWSYTREVPAYVLVVEHGAGSRGGASILRELRRRWGLEHPDTVAGVRVQFRPGVVGDTVLVGVDVLFRSFTYDLPTKELRRSPAPSWWGEVALDLAVPAFSPGGRYLAYLGRTPEDSLQAVVRSWPDGRVVARGPRSVRFPERFPAPARAAWADTIAFVVAYDAVLSRDIARVAVRGRVGDPILRVDSVSWFPYLDSVRAAAAAAARASEEADRAAWASVERLLDSAVHRISRLPAARFPELPRDFARELDSLGCAVPQSYFAGEPHNVIRGSFGAPGQEDWAALCSRAGVSVILVHWGGPVQCPREVGANDRSRAAPDRHYLQSIGGDRIGFSRRIVTTDSYHDHGEEVDQEDLTGVGEERPHYVKLDHDAIEDAFLEKASTVWYCKEGTWIALPGAD